MESGGFDQWTRRVAQLPRSRRGVLRLGLGGGLGLLGYGQVAQEASACVKTGKDCKKGKPNGACCSGTCRRGTCRPTPGAASCQVNSGDVCREAGQFDHCNNPAGACVQLDNGKPFCTDLHVCGPCTSHASSTQRRGGKCIKTCPICTLSSGGPACAYPPA